MFWGVSPLFPKPKKRLPLHRDILCSLSISQKEIVFDKKAFSNTTIYISGNLVNVIVTGRETECKGKISISLNSNTNCRNTSIGHDEQTELSSYASSILQFLHNCFKPSLQDFRVTGSSPLMNKKDSSQHLRNTRHHKTG